MKHAICLLAYKDINYMHRFIDQFENHKDIEFYIHWHNHDDNECKLLKSYSNNIKYVCNNFNTFRFSIDLVYAEMHLYKIALQNPEICICHLFSESNYLICNVNHFINYYNDNINNNFLTFIYDETINSMNFYKASQWKSLNRNTIQKLIDPLYLIDELLNELTKIHKPNGALDEIIIPTILKRKFNIDNNLKPNLCYINWINCRSHPNELTYSMYKDPSYQITYEEVTKNLTVRKIDIMNNDCKLFLDTMKIN